MILWAILLLVAAFLLVFLELVIPSFGTIALASLFCFGAAVVLAFTHSTMAGFIFVGVVVVGLPAAIYLGVKIFRHSPLGKRMILNGPTQDLSGGGAGFGGEETLLGREGVAQSTLRPAGIALIEGRRVDVVADSAMLEAGTPVVVVKVEGNRVVVHRREETAKPESG